MFGQKTISIEFESRDILLMWYEVDIGRDCGIIGSLLERLVDLSLEILGTSEGMIEHKVRIVGGIFIFDTAFVVDGVARGKLAFETKLNKFEVFSVFNCFGIEDFAHFE